MIRTWKESIKMFRYNLTSVIYFEIILKLLTLSVFLPVVYGILNFSVELADISFLNAGYIKKYFSAPSTYVLLLLIVLLMGLFIMINVSALIYAMEASHRRKKVNSLVLLVKGLANALRILFPKNMGMLLQILLIVPFTYTVAISGSLLGIRIPNFIKKIILDNSVVFGIILAIYLLLGIAAMFRIYVLNYFTLYGLNYREAVRMSKKTMKRHAFTGVVGAIVYNILLMLVLLLLEGTFTMVFAGIIKNVVSYKKMTFVINSAIQILFAVLYIVFSLIATPMVYSLICAGFYHVEGDVFYEEYDNGKKNKKNVLDSIEEHKKGSAVASLLITVVAVALNGLYIYMIISNKVNINIEYASRASVTAHRGDAENAPENTMAAFNLALENQADIIELDIRQTKDGQYIVMHDESLYRTTGVNKNVGELTLAEIEELDAGSSFSDEYAGEKIPTFSEILEFAKENDVFLNIELKPADTDHNYEQGIVDLLDEYDLVNNCVVASADYNVVRNVKRLNPDITTVYIMKMAFGEFGDMADVDIFSIKYTFISAAMVKNIHENGKLVFAWTVDNAEAIRRLVYLDVDSIITNDPYNTKDIIYNVNDSILSDFLQQLVEEY